MDKIFKSLGASNHIESERPGNDYYATDPATIKDLLSYERFNNKIWECACGEGHLSEALLMRGYNVKSTDLIDRGYSKQEGCLDFLNYKGQWDGDIITNPPYSLVNEFILKSLQVVKEGAKVALFLKLLTLEGQKRYNMIYANNPPKYIYIYSKRKECAKNGNFTGSSAICFCWYVWEKGWKGDPAIKWIKGEKRND